MMNVTVQPASTPFELPTLLSVIFSTENDGVFMALATFALNALLELISLHSTGQILRQKDGQNLYLKALACNLVNNGLLGPPLYWLVMTQFMQPALPRMTQLLKIGMILLGHGVGYYAAHRWMHTRKMYWAHRFHHRFNTNVSPVVANAVTPAEYFIAYMLPFVVGTAAIRPDRCTHARTACLTKRSAPAAARAGGERAHRMSAPTSRLLRRLAMAPPHAPSPQAIAVRRRRHCLGEQPAHPYANPG